MSNANWRYRRRQLAVLIAALVLALVAASTSIFVDGVIGTAFTPTVAACEHPGAGC